MQAISFESFFNTAEVESYFTKLASLESIKLTLEENSSLNKTPSRHILNAVCEAAAVISPNGLNAIKDVISLEHHESVYDVNNRLKLAIESVGEDIKNVVLKIVEWIKLAAKKIALHFDDIYSGAMAQCRKAAAIHDAAISDKLKYGPMKLDIKFSSDKQFIKILGSVDYGFLSSAYKHQMQAFSADFNRAIMVTAVSKIRDLVAKIGQFKTTQINNDDVAVLVDAAISQLEATVYKSFRGNDSEKRYGGLIGSNAFDLSIAKTGNFKTNISIDLISTDNSGSLANCLTADEVIHLSSLVMHHCKKGVFPDYVDVAKAMNSLADEIERVSNSIVRKHEVYGGEIVSLHMLKKLTQTLMKTSQLIYTYNARVSAAINAYCVASLKELEKHYIPEE